MDLRLRQTLRSYKSTGSQQEAVKFVNLAMRAGLSLEEISHSIPLHTVWCVFSGLPFFHLSKLFKRLELELFGTQIQLLEKYNKDFKIKKTPSLLDNEGKQYFVQIWQLRSESISVVRDIIGSGFEIEIQYTHNPKVEESLAMLPPKHPSFEDYPILPAQLRCINEHLDMVLRYNKGLLANSDKSA